MKTTEYFLLFGVLTIVLGCLLIVVAFTLKGNNVVFTPKCKHCGEPIYQQQQGAWVHSTFDDGGYISCLDHKEKKFIPHRKSTYAEPLYKYSEN